LTNLSRSKNSGRVISSPLNGRKIEVRSPLISRRQVLILDSKIFFPVFLERNTSKNLMVEVMSHTWEITHPPLLHGEATIRGTRNPKPTGASRDLSGAKPACISSSKVTNSPSVPRPDETFPLPGSWG